MLPQWQLCGYFGLILSFQSYMYLYIVFHILVHSYRDKAAVGKK
jgi:hypothetical protein